MARINIDDSLFADLRFMELAEHYESEIEAVGVLVMFWRAASVYYQDDRKPIPKTLFDKRFPKLLDFGFARLSDDGEGVFACGSEKFFEWRLTRSEAGRLGGVNSGKSRKTQTKTKQTKQSFKANEAKDRSPKLSLSNVSLSKSQYSNLNKDLNNKISEKSKNESASLSARSPDLQGSIKAYYEAYEAKYGVKLRLTGKDIGILKRLVGTVGEARLCELLQVYLQMDTKWFETRHHDLVTFESCLAEIQVAHGTGKTAAQRKQEKTEKFIFGEEDNAKAMLQRPD